MNIVVLIGRLTRDPELRYTASSGNAMARFTVAIDRGLSKEKRAELEQKGQPTADFVGCVAWGKTAETIGRYFSKGKPIAIHGRIQTGSYEAQDGTRRYTTDVVVDRFEFIDFGQQSTGMGQNQFNQGSAIDQSSYNKGSAGGGFNAPNDFGMGDDAFPIDDDDIPF